ncbi:hypothetical protein ERO13_D06G108800v2 [Gossypium hirsutum]|uniref:Fasciclin-like arabinogalactan protein 3 precursor n=5 Tax=Gossypium TaxID=3633 RepID=A0ABM2BI52_GOSHI|nr:fasciclin-like arabinogalactan protein 3 precursor [Gossypium hirsutum]KAB2025034.1 hypothetical protein ES319_D06G125700v1 [Gossypium barbadense]TYG64768.1 hypothetical protein ES288_D06G134600v1 [Gossypium darwinii]TYH66627.1 hypothetical protein ES332_D06G137000v1 [Gossypium tomentosum]TYI77169.1 hypothetical protein E1A91_D06G127400v1 [Gossypium mustelinum]KAG4142022.1 hypothetical protein ERO13_D06G108800v2 [Gossypium hirsutum]
MGVSANANTGAFLLFFIAAILLALSTTCTALNITKSLAPYSDYSTLSDLFRKTKLTDAINRRQTITILALDNSSIQSITDRSSDELRKILMNHIILDYYDRQKIQKLGKKSALLTTLYQTTGSAINQQGFVNITRIARGEVVFGSAVKGAPLVGKLLGSVISQPFNLSVLHISTPIVAPGFGDAILAPPPPPGSSKPPAAAPKKSPSSPGPSEEEEDEDEAESPSPSESPVESPKAGKAKAKSRSESPPEPDSDEDDDAEEPTSSASSRVVWLRVGVAAVIGLIASLVAF